MGERRISRDERRLLRNAQRRVIRARNHDLTWICSASRHLHLIADALASGKPYPMLDEEPGHCALTIYSVLESLWKERAARHG